ncbi:MAG: CRISPR-associated protein Cas4 [Blastocatellia bacterium AA13]|nr:MAG: CRISPR-associated protein Cas4 [Blastocatellia bacterium AA13]
MLDTDETTALDNLIPLRVTDLKEYEYCPRVVFYNTVMPVERKTTLKMERGKDEEFRLDALEKRRSLKRYELASGKRSFHVWLESKRLGLTGKLDLLISSPRGYFPVDFKYSQSRPHRNYAFQLAGYALLVEEAFGAKVETGFIYLLPAQEVVAVEVTPRLKEEAVERLAAIRDMIKDGILPPPTPFRNRCEDCEFRNYCGDVF